MLTQSQKDQVSHHIRSLQKHGFTFRDVVRLLDLDSDDRRSLQHFLDELDSEGVIHRVKKGRYALPSRENLVSGVLTCHRDGYGFLVPDDRTIFKEDIFIPGRNMEEALHGDRVLVKVERKKTPSRRNFGRRRVRTEEGKERFEGAVVKVLERKHPTIVGRFHEHSRFPFVVPLDARMIHDIRIPFQSSKGAQDGQIVVVAITIPPGRNQIPHGKVTEILGRPEDPGIEYKIVEHKFGLPVEFSPEALEEAEAIPDRVLKEERAHREDFREETIVTIDGETARDFDDAVSLKKLPSGNFLLGVHIADVAYYVREGMAIDTEAYERGTSVYFPDRAIPMLPPKLSSGICSLKPGVDRLVLSALMEIDSKGKMIGYRLVQGIIRSRERMTYTAVAKILSDQDPNEKERYDGLGSAVRRPWKSFVSFFPKRDIGGAQSISTCRKPDIQFDKNGKVISVLPAERNIAHRIIEEFMLQANECIADGFHLFRRPGALPHSRRTRSGKSG